MNDYLTYLAERAYCLHRFLYVLNPHAISSADCYERIEVKAKYEEITSVINSLPEKERKKVRKRYKEFQDNPPSYLR
ncbi:hypothetical protein P8918_12515 [Bacillus spizizenii]|nr:hypothetical protein [Bacillus spizizenii]MCY8890393.1 hypothetical protein [Bacillus spizizenii]MEC0841848.1 hypothetical protein [Bacillus spizizenii]